MPTDPDSIDWILIAQKYLAALAAIATAIWTLYRLLIRKHVRRIAAWFESVEQHGTQLTALSNQVAAVDRRVGRIEAELQPNGGSSTRDAIERIENAMLLVTQSADYMLTDAGVASFKANVDGEWISVNRGCAVLMQRTPDELMGNGWRNALASDDALSVAERWESAVEDEREFSAYVSVQTPAMLKRCRIQAYALRNSQGQYVGYQGFVREVPPGATHAQ